MKAFIISAALLLAGVTAAPAQPLPVRWHPDRYPPPPVVRVPNLNGTWILNGRPDAVCQIIQRGPGRRALFVNEHGSEAWGDVGRTHVWIPDWEDRGRPGLWGSIEGDRIVWPDGSYWSRPDSPVGW